MKLFESAKFSKLAPTFFHQLNFFESAKFSKLAPALSWQLAPLGIPTGSCLHLPDCRQLPRHYSHFAATQCYCAQYFCILLCSISALQCAAFLSYCAQYFARSAPLCITWVRINYGLLCPCAQCDRGSCWSSGRCEYVELYFIYNQFTMFLCLPQDVLWLSHFIMKRPEGTKTSLWDQSVLWGSHNQITRQDSLTPLSKWRHQARYTIATTFKTTSFCQSISRKAFRPKPMMETFPSGRWERVGRRPTSFNPGLPFFLPLPPWQWIHGESGGIWAVIHYLPKAPTPENSQIWQGIVRSGYDTEIGRIQLLYIVHHPHFYAH